MKHKPQIVEGSRLADVAGDQCDGDYQRFPEVLTIFGERRPGITEKFFRVEWPDHCVTTQHLGDATIHGPFDTEEESER